MSLRRLGYNDQYEVWSHVQQANGWVDPWKNTPEGMMHYREKEREKEQKRAINEAAAKEDHEKQKAEALANPAPMLKSTIKPGFFSSNPAAPTKSKKTSKDKEPKVKKEKSSGKEKESVSNPKIAPGTSQASSSSGSNTAGAGTGAVESTVLETELGIRKSGPGSAGGKLAVAKRFQREKVEGRASTISTPTRSPRPLPAASTSKNSTPTASDSRKRKVDDDEFDGEPLAKKKKVVAQVATAAPAAAPSSLLTPRGKPVTKRKGEDIGSLSPPSKIRKDVKSSVVTHAHNGSVSSTQGHAYSTGVKNGAARKDKTSATGDFNRDKSRKRTSWDYSTDEDSSTPPSQRKSIPGRLTGNGKGLAPPQNARASGSRGGWPTPHPVAPPTNYLGFKAVFLQKLAEYEMVRGILLGEEAKLANARVGDSSQALMGVIELRRLVRKRDSLQVELREVKAEIARLNGIARSGTSGSR